MTAPVYLPAFRVQKIRGRRTTSYRLSDVETGALLATGAADRREAGDAMTFHADADRSEPVFSFGLRAPGEYDVFDERGEAIGYFRPDHLSAPYLEAAGHRIRRGFVTRVEFWDEQYPVLVSERRYLGRDLAVTVPDRRLAFRLAAALVVALDMTST